MRQRRFFAWMRRITQLTAFGFVCWAAWLIHQQWTGLPTNISVLGIVLAGLSLVAGNFILGFAWCQILSDLSNIRLPQRWLMRVFLASNLGRYMPGKVALPAIRLGALGELGMAPAVVGTSIGLELVSWACTCGVVAFGLLSWAAPQGLAATVGAEIQLPSWMPPALLLMFLATVGLLLRVDQDRLPQRLRKLLGLTESGPLLKPRVLVLHLAYWASWWLHGVLLLRGLGDNIYAVAPAFVLAPVIGFLALIAPAGAGVREALVIALATPVIGLSHAVAVSLLSRTLSLAADVGAWLLAVGMTLVSGKSPRQTEAGACRERQ